jgi:exosortase/archaeosortase family protein
MATVPSQLPAVKFALRGVAWSLGLLGLLRLNWTEVHAVLPFTRAEAAAATALFGPSVLPVEATLACSGADAIALCLGAILAYPAPWRTRLAGAAAGAALIVGLNTLRIGTLGRAVASPQAFNALHLYVWPALLTLAIAGYVFAWMYIADRQLRPGSRMEASGTRSVAPPLAPPQLTRRFAILTATFLLIFLAASPLYLESPGVLALAGFIARAAAVILGAAGVTASAAANVLWTPHGGFQVTQECISTPLIPVYLAAVCAHPGSWRRLIVGILAAGPLFAALGVARLLVVALPGATAASPLFLIHAFYQLLLGAVVVLLAARWRHVGAAAILHALVGISVGVGFVIVLGPLYTRVVSYPGGPPLDDPQGAIAFFPAFQIGLYMALWIAASVGVGWRRFVAGFAALGLTQTMVFLALPILGSHAGLMAHVRDVRGWAVAAPVLIVAAMVNLGRPPREAPVASGAAAIARSGPR